ncbi:MAG TPA: DMT family transporter [Oscillatoriaceae cyanobacterium]
MPLARLLPVLAIVGSVLSLCIGSSYAKTLFPLLGPQGTTAIRLLVGTCILLTVWRPWRWPLSRRGAALIACYGVVLGVMNLTFYLAIARIPLAVAIAIEFTGPLTLSLVSSKRALDIVWIAFAALGLALLLPFQQHAAHLDPLGVVFALAAAVCWALYIITGQRAGNLHGGQATSLGLLVGALVILPIGWHQASRALLRPSLLASGLVVGLLSSALPYSLEMFALKRLPKQTFGILLSMEPAVGALVAMGMIDEVLTPRQWLAIMAIMLASIGSTICANPSSALATS